MFYVKTVVTPLIYIFTFLVALKLSTGTLGIIMGWCDMTNKVCQLGTESKWIWGILLSSILLLLTSAARIWLFAKKVKRAWYEAKVEQFSEIVDSAWAKKDVATAVAAYSIQERYATRLGALRRPVERNPDEILGEIMVDIDPKDWIEAQSVDVRHFVATHWNWDYDLTILRSIINQSDCDQATAASVFWLAGTDDDQLPFGEIAPSSPEDILIFEMLRSISLRFEKNSFSFNGFSFLEDWGRIFELPEQRFKEGLIDWNPSYVPKSISGQEVLITSFTSLKRSEIRAFLSRHGSFV